MTSEISNLTPLKQAATAGASSNDLAVNATKTENSTPVQQQNAPTQSIVDVKDLEQSITRINDYVQSIQRDLEFSIDERSGKQVIKVFDRASEEVVRQIPTEAVLAIAENIESLKGILFSAEA